MSQRTCSAYDPSYCNSFYARGLCRRHYMRAYMRARRGGLPIEAAGPRERADRRPSRLALCEFCGDEFVSVSRGKTMTRFCSKSCRGKAEYQAGKVAQLALGNRDRTVDPSLTPRERQRRKAEASRRRRRARIAGAEREPYTTAEIAERDGFRCWLCNRKVNMSLTYPHPRSASIDHIVPLSRGGEDTKVNVRLAHLGENIARSNRAEWEQQLLIG